MERVKTYLIVALVVFVAILGLFTIKEIKDLAASRDQLTTKDLKIQQMDVDLGLAKANLTDIQTLNNEYKNEISLFPDKLKSIIKNYDLQIKSRDKTIASLEGKITGGTTVVTVGNGGLVEPDSQPSKPTRYEWLSKDNRFHLVDPDIFTPGNEEFTYKQSITMTGYVFQGKDGNLQIRRMEVKEVLPQKAADGHIEYVPIPDSSINVVDSKFEYTNSQLKSKELYDVITLRSFASFDSSLNPGLGIEWANLGRLVDYWNVGINSKIVADVSDPLHGSLQDSRLDLGIDYQLAPPLVDSNLAIGFAVGTPFNHFGSPDNLVFTVNAIFFITNDYNPFKK